MRERLTALALTGNKVATGDLLQREYVDQGEDIEHVGEVQVLLGPDGPVALVEITRVETHRFIDVPWEFAYDEGEGPTSIEGWREGHWSYYEHERVVVSNDCIFVCVWFRIISDPRQAWPTSDQLSNYVPIDVAEVSVPEILDEVTSRNPDLAVGRVRHD